MTDTSLPPHLERIGRQLIAAAHERSPAPRRSRHRGFRLAALSTTGLALIATAAVLAVGAITRTQPAFAVTRLHNGSVSLKINRRTPLADVNRKLAAMGIERIGKPTAGGDVSSIPNCASIPAGWKGVWVQMAGSSSGPGYKISEAVPPGTWVLVHCYIGNPPGDPLGNPGATGVGNTGNTGAG